MIRVAVNGACGRMGSKIASLVCKDKGLELVAALEREGHPLLGKDVGSLAGEGDLGVKVTDTLNGKADVLIDFSEPSSSVAKAALCASKGIALVVGTTGHTEEQLASIKKSSQRIPCLISPNMSLGVNLLFQTAAQIARALGEDYDIEIVEVHHRFKKDAPSGTALKLAQEICKATGRELKEAAVYGRQGIMGERPKGQIGLHALRVGDTVGDHKVIFGTLGETIELVHSAHSRDTFALGALRAAKFLAGKPPGLYEMRQVISL
ncbi:MAG TPA: 4-hydroxy-tetrahydrodipicolinate reductase [Candidatus Tripitaka californicus]|uniref:4-hydroxy-tetrahydrodipicolinate reductase n=1 Tax=Candidatus Tripitaka californicus TaxID=3367616 RepID=UPI0040269A0C